MTRRAIVLIVLVMLLVVGLVLGLAHSASAEPATQICDAALAHGFHWPADQPCPAHEEQPADPTHYCTGYGQMFTGPCPKPPDTVCSVHPEEFACTGPGKDPVPDAGIGQVAPEPTTEPTSAPETAPTEISATVVVHDAPKTTQRRTAPRRRPTTTTTTIAPWEPDMFLLRLVITEDF